MLNYAQQNITSPIIVALDYDNEPETMHMVAKLDPQLCKLKVGKELFTACGPKLVEKLVLSGFDVFLDLKFHDIPNTVYKACIAATNLGVWMLNVHVSGGEKMLNMAREAVNKATTNKYKPLLIGVTILTSMTQSDLSSIGLATDINMQIQLLAQLAYRSGLDGVVCAAHEAAFIKNACQKSFLTVCPAIRLDKLKTDDQQRVMSVAEALNNQADYLVIGRPITQSVDPYKTLLEIVNMTCNH